MLSILSINLFISRLIGGYAQSRVGLYPNHSSIALFSLFLFISQSVFISVYFLPTLVDKS